jgi:hypothetical protein
MKTQCHLPCATEYPTAITVLRAPDELNDDQEIETRDWNDWAIAGYAYGRVKTGTAREVLSAGQTHGQVDAVVFSPWGTKTKDLTNSNALKINGSYYHIIGAINVDELNVEMQFICRKRMQ